MSELVLYDHITIVIAVNDFACGYLIYSDHQPYCTIVSDSRGLDQKL